VMARPRTPQQRPWRGHHLGRDEREYAPGQSRERPPNLNSHGNRVAATVGYAATKLGSVAGSRVCKVVTADGRKPFTIR
jgi:hypothetical protein